MLPRLQAEQALLDAQVAMLPHYSGTKTDKRAGQKIRMRVLNAWRALAHPPKDGELPEYDRHGRRILRSFSEVKQLFQQWGVG